ncbi:MAG: DUF2950 family protein [Planctomycetota bacterium]
MVIAISNVIVKPIALSGEQLTVIALHRYVAAQREFRKQDWYGTGKLVYANPTDGVGLRDLFEIRRPDKGTSTKPGLIPKEFAEADVRVGKHWRGYLFADISADEAGALDYTKQFALCAFPDPTVSGFGGAYMFVVNHEGRVYCSAAHSPRTTEGVPVEGYVPVTVWPDVRTWIEVSARPPYQNLYDRPRTGQ